MPNNNSWLLEVIPDDCTAQIMLQPFEPLPSGREASVHPRAVLVTPAAQSWPVALGFFHPLVNLPLEGES